MAAQPRRTGHAEFYKLCQWIVGNRDRLLRERPSEPMLAREASRVLGIEIAGSTIGDAKLVTGVQWIALSSGRAGVSGSLKTNTLAKHVAELYRKLGEPVPAELLPYVARGPVI